MKKNEDNNKKEVNIDIKNVYNLDIYISKKNNDENEIKSEKTFEYINDVINENINKEDSKGGHKINDEIMKRKGDTGGMEERRNIMNKKIEEKNYDNGTGIDKEENEKYEQFPRENKNGKMVES